MYRYRLELLDAIEAALTYDFLQHRSTTGGDRAPAIVREYMSERFQSDLLVKRRIVDRLADHVDGGQPVLLVGAPGGGKTASLLRLNYERRLAAGEADETARLVVFNGNKNAAQLQQRRSLDEKTEYITDKIARAISKRFFRQVGDEDQTARFERSDGLGEADWHFYLYKNATQFEGLRSILRTDSKVQFAAKIQEGGVYTEEWLRSYNEFRALPAVDRLRRMIEILNGREIRLAVAIDNCDQLSNLDLAAAKRATNDIHGLTSYGLSVIVAVRPTTAGRATRHLGFAPFNVLYLNAFEKLDEDDDTSVVVDEDSRGDLRADLQHVKDIFERRLELFESETLLGLIDASLAERGIVPNDGDQRAIRGDIARFRGASERVLRDYFSFDADPDANPDPDVDVEPVSRRVRAERHDLTTAFVKWHNGSIREIARSLFHYITRYIGEVATEADAVAVREAAQTEDSPTALISDGIFRHSIVKNARTTLFRHLIFFATTREDVDDEGFPIIHESLRLFDPSAAVDEAAFAFPRLRILQYLYKRRHAGTVSFADMQTSLDGVDFHVTELQRITIAMASRVGYESGLLRIEDVEDDAFVEFERTVLSPEATIELLPAGEFLVSRLCHVVEFVFWSALSEPYARHVVANSLQVSEGVLTDPAWFNRASRRAEVALTYLTEVVADRFKMEHPYLEPGHVPKQVEIAKLRTYCNLFGFGPGDWHFNRSLKQIERFLGRSGQRKTGIPISHEAEERIVRLRELSAQLDSVHRRGRK